jgi:hypothetical protein
MHHAATVANALSMAACAIAPAEIEQARERLEELGYETVVTDSGRANRSRSA